MFQGIIAGCDRNQEWLLPWWWKHYSTHNSYPVLFIDFGLSEEGRAWCSERGECIRLPSIQRFILGKKSVPSERGNAWEQHYGKKIWSRRRIWFQKPFALLLSPFPFSLWLDLDCQVQGNLEPLFNCLAFGIDIAVKRDIDAIQELHQKRGFIQPGEVNYDCGLIAFRKEAPILLHWAQEVKERNDQFVFDQQALSRAIARHQPSLLELPPIYNWSAVNGANPKALVVHFHGGFLKQTIQAQQVGV